MGIVALTRSVSMDVQVPRIDVRRRVRGTTLHFAQDVVTYLSRRASDRLWM